MSRSLTAVIGLLCLAGAMSLPVNTVEKEAHASDPLPPVPPTSKCTVYGPNMTACVADDCCNWCSLSMDSTIGFCMAEIPNFPPPTSKPIMQCQKSVGDCKSKITADQCAEDTTCKWAPFGPPGTPVGMCVYDWSRCSSPVEVKKVEAVQKWAAKEEKKAVAAGAPVPPVPPVPPPLNCTALDQPTCDKATCCQWCGTPFSPIAIGWCMAISNKPIPALTCSKSPEGCETIKTQAQCMSYDLCAWVPYGPPGSMTGSCLFNWAKCTAYQYGPQF